VCCEFGSQGEELESGVDGFGTKGASMNQIMVNAVEFDSLLKEVEYLNTRESKA
jgi:hypothetical protein